MPLQEELQAYFSDLFYLLQILFYLFWGIQQLLHKYFVGIISFRMEMQSFLNFLYYEEISIK